MQFSQDLGTQRGRAEAPTAEEGDETKRLTLRIVAPVKLRPAEREACELVLWQRELADAYENTLPSTP